MAVYGSRGAKGCSWDVGTGSGQLPLVSDGHELDLLGLCSILLSALVICGLTCFLSSLEMQVPIRKFLHFHRCDYVVGFAEFWSVFIAGNEGIQCYVN